MTPEEAEQDKSRQQAHAAEIRQRREAQSGGNSQLQAMIQAEVRSAVAAELAGLVLQGGQGISVSGGGKNWTISAQSMTWTGIGQCGEDGTVTINLQST